MRVSRRGLLSAGSSAILVGAIGAPHVARAQKAEFTYKFANNLPDTHPINVRGREMAEALRAESGGRFAIKLFPSNQLGSDTDTLSQLRSGGVEFFTLSPLILATLVPTAAISGIGYAFPDYDAVWSAMDGELGAWVRKQIAKANLVAMEKIWDNGYRQTTSSTRPIATPADFKGFKIRVPVSPMWTSLFKAFDAAPTSINFNETYSSLQTKIVEGQENPLALIATAKLYEVQKYCSLTNHMWDGYWFMANRKAFERIPEDLRAIVVRHINAAALNVREDVAKLNASLQDDLAKKGLTFNKPDIEPFREKLRQAGFYAEWKGRFGEEGWALLEKTCGKLA